MKRMLFIHSLSQGGAERDIAEMANHWADEGHEVTVLTLADASDDSYPLRAGIRRVGLRLMRESNGLLDAVRWNWRRLRAVRGVVRQVRPDCLVSFVEKSNVLALLATRFLGVPVVVSERTDPRRYAIGRIWSWLRRRLYPRADALVVMTESVRAWGEQTAGGRPVHVIPNPARLLSGSGASHRSQDELAAGPPQHRIVGMGRLHPQKGFDLLIEAFARLAPRFPDWRLDIYGDGEDRTRLERQIAALGLEHRAALPGWTDRPADVYRAADVFVLSSRYEGYGNVLAEAMAAGVAVVSFDCDSGPRELIRQEVDGILVPPENVEQLASAIERLIVDPQFRQRLARRAPEVLQRFTAERFFQQWDAVLAAATSRARRGVCQDMDRDRP